MLVASYSRMHTILDLVYRYRNLIGRCELGAGLDLDGIEALSTIEALFDQEPAPGPGAAENAAPVQGSLAGAPVDLRALLRNRSLHDEVQVVTLGPGGCTVRRAPYADEGDLIEMVVDEPASCRSYRFKARVAWLLDDEDDDFALGLSFVGTPLLLHYGPPSAAAAPPLPLPVAHKIAA